jgi:hypothetical protein
LKTDLWSAPLLQGDSYNEKQPEMRKDSVSVVVVDDNDDNNNKNKNNKINNNNVKWNKES